MTTIITQGGGLPLVYEQQQSVLADIFIIEHDCSNYEKIRLEFDLQTQFASVQQNTNAYLTLGDDMGTNCVIAGSSFYDNSGVWTRLQSSLYVPLGLTLYTVPATNPNHTACFVDILRSKNVSEKGSLYGTYVSGNEFSSGNVYFSQFAATLANMNSLTYITIDTNASLYYYTTESYMKIYAK